MEQLYEWPWSQIWDMHNQEDSTPGEHNIHCFLRLWLGNQNPASRTQRPKT